MDLIRRAGYTATGSESSELCRRPVDLCASWTSRSTQLARHLQSLGVGPESLVGLCVERGLEMVVGVLAVLKAGGCVRAIGPSFSG